MKTHLFVLLLLTSLVLNGCGPSKDSWEAGAARGEAEAQLYLGTHLYHNAQSQLATAAMWYRKAADQGLSIAQYSLAGCYADGAGVPRDEVEACKWLLLAAAQGHAQAKLDLAALEKSLPTTQINEARKRTDEWKPVPKKE